MTISADIDGAVSYLEVQNWNNITLSLDEYGYIVLPRLLSVESCIKFSASYTQQDSYRKRIMMAQHGFGQGEYKYFGYPLPPLLNSLRQSLYLYLAPIANRWNQMLGFGLQYPNDFNIFLDNCHQAGQKRSTPLILQYKKEDYNCLHQDIYGAYFFPLQVAILLSKPGHDFTGGEFVMVENDGGFQKSEVVNLDQGDAVVFAVSQRPKIGKRGAVRKSTTRHGVSRIRDGFRHTLGIIFHDSL